MTTSKAGLIKETRWDGKPISKPGVYAGIPIDIYHSQKICVGTSVSSSGLRRMLEENGGSPAHFFVEWEGNANALEPEQKDYFAFGRAVHHLFLGEAAFYETFIIRPGEIEDEQGEIRPWNGNRNACKAWLEKARGTGRTIVTLDQVETIKAMAKQIAFHPLVKQLLTGLIERSIVWRDAETGLWIKVRPDAIPTHSGEFVDLKTTMSVQYRDLQRAITDHAYHQQMALIRTAAREVLKLSQTTFALLFQEKKAPWWPRVMEIKDSALDLGEQQNRKALKLMAECMKTKNWPGPGGYDVSFLDVEDGYRKKVERTV